MRGSADADPAASEPPFLSALSSLGKPALPSPSMEKGKTLDNTGVEPQPEPLSVLALNVLVSGPSTPLLDPLGGPKRSSGTNQFLAGTLRADAHQLTLSPGRCTPAYVPPHPPSLANAHQLRAFHSK